MAEWIPLARQNGVRFASMDATGNVMGSAVGSPQSVISTMQSYGNGSRAIIHASRRVGERGHIFNAVNENGVIQILDGQIGAAGGINMMKGNGYQRYNIFRTN